RVTIVAFGMVSLVHVWWRLSVVGAQHAAPLHRYVAPTSSHSPYIVAIDGVMPGTNPGAAMMRIPSATIARASGTSMAALPGSSIAAIMTAHRATKNANEPSGVETPMSIPCIWRTVTTQAVAARPRVAASAVRL